MTRVTRGPISKKLKEIVEVKTEPVEENDNRDMETVPKQIPTAEEEEIPFKMSPLSHSYPDMQENFLEQAESFRR